MNKLFLKRRKGNQNEEESNRKAMEREPRNF